MSKEFISFPIESYSEKEICQIDITNLSTLELIKLKEELKNTTFSEMIPALDKLIYNNMDEFNASKDMFGNGYRKAQKRNNKVKKQARMKKCRRR